MGLNKCGGCGANCALQGYSTASLVCDPMSLPIKACGCTSAYQCAPEKTGAEDCVGSVCKCGGALCNPGEVCRALGSGGAGGTSGAGGTFGGGGTSGIGGTSSGGTNSGGTTGGGGTVGGGGTSGVGGTNPLADSGVELVFECSCNGGPACLAGGIQTACCPGVGCKDLAQDSSNCGACGRLCPPGFACDNGKCMCQVQSDCQMGGATVACIKQGPNQFCQCGSTVCPEGARCFPGNICR